MTPWSRNAGLREVCEYLHHVDGVPLDAARLCALPCADRKFRHSSAAARFGSSYRPGTVALSDTLLGALTSSTATPPWVSPRSITSPAVVQPMICCVPAAERAARSASASDVNVLELCGKRRRCRELRGAVGRGVCIGAGDRVPCETFRGVSHAGRSRARGRSDSRRRSAWAMARPSPTTSRRSSRASGADSRRGIRRRYSFPARTARDALRGGRVPCALRAHVFPDRPRRFRMPRT